MRAQAHAGHSAQRPIFAPGLGLPGWFTDLRESLETALRAAITAEIDARRLFLWLPVLFGGGILLYFAADREPSLWAPASVTGVFAVGAIAAHVQERIRVFRACLALAMLFGGLAAAALQTRLAAAPVIGRTIVGRTTAYIETVDDNRSGGRMLLRVLSVDGLSPDATPARVRVTTRTRPAFAAGTTISATMRLMPPPRPSEPGGYDFARDAWFDRIGGVGNVVGRLEQATDADVPLTARVNAWIDRGRNALTDRIVGVVGGGGGAVTAALVTGKRGLIPEPMNDDLRGAGIYHVVSISGVHMVLAAGLFLWSMRALLALFPQVALRRPIKKWAAAFAITGAVAYDVFAGSEVATERSLAMTAVILIAVLFDRPALSMRNLAIAALIVLVREPVTLLGPSFQMSFAAVAAMIAAFERNPSHDRTETTNVAPTGLDRIRRVLVVMVATTLVASLATDPFATFHFHRFNPYGLIGNSLTLPVVEFIVMPMSLFGVAAWPFGLDAPAWWIAGQGVGLMMSVSHWVSGLSGSTRYLPAFGGGAVLLMTAAILWIVIWQSWIRWGGVAFAVVGVALAAVAPRPDVVIDSRAQTVALRAASGSYEVLNQKANLFGVSQWLTADADPRSPRDPELIGHSRCDRQGCVGALADGRVLSFAFDRAALAEDCRRADIVVTRLWAADLCRGPDVVLDGRHFDGFGATEIRFGPEGEAILHTHRTPDYDRPWSPARPLPPRTAATAAPPDAAEEPNESDPTPFMR